MANYSVDDEHSNKLTTGLSGYDAARRVAQRMADDRGKSVWLYEDCAGAWATESEEIRPGGGR